MGEPSEAYAEVAGGFISSARAAVAMHLFLTDVVGVEDTEEGQALGLGTLLELMEGQAEGLDRQHVFDNAGDVHDLLRDLRVNKAHEFMADLVSVVSVCGVVVWPAWLA